MTGRVDASTRGHLLRVQVLYTRYLLLRTATDIIPVCRIILNNAVNIMYV